MTEGAGVASLAGALAEEFAGNMRGICWINKKNCQHKDMNDTTGRTTFLGEFGDGCLVGAGLWRALCGIIGVVQITQQQKKITQMAGTYLEGSSASHSTKSCLRLHWEYSSYRSGRDGIQAWRRRGLNVAREVISSCLEREEGAEGSQGRMEEK